MSSTTITDQTRDAPPSPAPPALPAPAQRAPMVISTAPGRNTVRKILLGCGVLSSVLYIAADVYAWSQYPGYSPVSQAFSELLAEGAPTRSFMVVVAGAPYNLLVAALGVAVWASPIRRRMSRITGAMLVLYAVISYLGGTVFQMDVRGTEGTARSNLHPLATALMVLFMLLSMGFGAFLHGMRFRLYSIVTLLTVIVFADLTFLYAPQIAANEPTPWLGLIERISIYAWMCWVAVLAISLWTVRGVIVGGHLGKPIAEEGRCTY